MSSIIIPKERLTAYQRWEMASFDTDEAELHIQTNQPHAELVNVKEAARAAGHAEGYAAGMQAARAMLDGQKKSIQQISDSLQAEVSQFSQTMAEEVLKLALDLTKVMVQQALTVHPQLIIPVVQEALNRLPPMVHPIQLAVNGDDARLLKEAFADEITSFGLKVRVDNTLTRGGCKLETTASQVDATMESRWKRLTHALSQSGPWLE
ncbi:MAG: flagellar assembly protein FliH [Thiobacillaceae bacterium]